jgi:preprotein translocase subunit SecF
MEQNARTVRAVMIAALLMLLTTIGCGPAADLRDQRLADFAKHSNEQQARQNEAMAKQSQAVVEESQKLAEAAQQLVQSDAKARTDMLAAQERLTTQLDEQRAAVDTGRDRLEQERKQMAAERHRDPIVAASIQTIGLILAALLPLAVCIYVIRQMCRTEPDDAAVASLLVTELTADRPVLLPGPALRPAPALEHHVGPYLPCGEASDEQPDATDLPF